jgi:two-component system chemotaxis response regulator CheY
MKRVLVVDDSRSARMIFIRCLKIVGFSEAEFIEAGDGQEAIEAIETAGSVDLAIIDLNMPTMDGFTLLRRLKADTRCGSLPVVVASSLINDAVRRRLREEGAHAVVEKPISPISLKAALAGIDGGEADAATDPTR